jgi:hypothetical protein
MTIEMVDTNGISPGGAAVNSQGCKPLEGTEEEYSISPGGATVPPPLRGWDEGTRSASSSRRLHAWLLTAAPPGLG